MIISFNFTDIPFDVIHFDFNIIRKYPCVLVNLKLYLLCWHSDAINVYIPSNDLST